MIERSDGSFQLSANAHNHPADPRAAVCAAIKATVKAKAAADIFRPASAIVEEVLLDQMKSTQAILKYTQAIVYRPSCQQEAPAAMTKRPARSRLRVRGKPHP